MQRSPISDWTINRLLAWTTDHFKAHRIDSARSTAELLLAHALNLPRVQLYVQYDKPLNSRELATYRSLIKRRLNREPTAYILGTRDFWTFSVGVADAVLIPRPETECLVETGLAFLDTRQRSGAAMGPQRILELGTGSGAVVLALASEKPGNVYFASDISPRAVAIARSNAEALGLVGKVRFFCGDWLHPVSSGKGCFHLIVSNPPYIPKAQIPRLQPEINRYEPNIALDGGRDGLDCLRHLIGTAHAHMPPGGCLMVEIGHDQRRAVETIVDRCGHYQGVACTKDYGGHDRVVRMVKKGGR